VAASECVSAARCSERHGCNLSSSSSSPTHCLALWPLVHQVPNQNEVVGAGLVGHLWLRGGACVCEHLCSTGGTPHNPPRPPPLTLFSSSTSSL
jgi:hypothetical protein